jgi:dienelactone hydrolase
MTIEDDFRLERDTGAVPGVLWRPDDATGPLPLVLLGHGGMGHKRTPRIVELGRWFADAGLAAAAIDSVYYGDRVPALHSREEYEARVVAEGVETVIDHMIGDWEAVVAHWSAAGVADGDRLGYVGMSMGTRYGLPLVATLGERVRSAVLGKYGLRSTMNPGMDGGARLARDAARITVPVLYHAQLDDTLFPYDGQRALFDRLATTDKELISYPGPHGVTDPAAVERWRTFIAERC